MKIFAGIWLLILGACALPAADGERRHGELGGALQALAPAGLDVCVYSGHGADAGHILAMYRAIQAIGHTPLSFTKADIDQGRLTTALCDVLVIPEGTEGKRCCGDGYADVDGLDAVGTKDAMRSYLQGGGGMVMESVGAYFSAQNGGTFDVYAGSYTNVTTAIGKHTFGVTDPAFGSGSFETWMTYGGGYFPSPPAGVTTVATEAGKAVIVRQSYGAGRLIMTAYTLELRGDSELDWTKWDDWAMGGAHASSIGTIGVLGRMINWAYNGDSSAPVVNYPANPAGARVAIAATHNADGGAWPGGLGATARATESAGHVPLAIRFDEIKSGRLIQANFHTVVFPGGYSYGYKTGLAGYEQKVRDFVSGGGSFLGICAGAFYVADTVIWENKSYAYPMGLFHSAETGPMNDIIAWPGYALTPARIADPVIGSLGVRRVIYYGGGYFQIPTDAQQGAHVNTAATFDYAGAQHGSPMIVRYVYGAGHVLLSTTHFEYRPGSHTDWQLWDDYQSGSTLPLNNPDDTWAVLASAFNNWLVL
jgi:glutamine amidotransferase-like uncharacterized protein